MKNVEVWANYEDYTRDLTAQARKLGFGAAAVCWFFKSPAATFPKAVLVALLLIVVFFLLDMAQHLIAAKGIRNWMLSAEQEMWEKAKTIEGDYLKPSHLDRIPFRLFQLKLIVLLAAFVALISEFGMRLLASGA